MLISVGFVLPASSAAIDLHVLVVLFIACQLSSHRQALPQAYLPWLGCLLPVAQKP